MSQFFASGGQHIGVSASASVLPMSIQDLFPLGWTGWISLQSKGLSRIFSNTTPPTPGKPKSKMKDSGKERESDILDETKIRKDELEIISQTFFYILNF